nr:hypothetical protein [Paracoccus sp. (in: a-proteobacteria)]
MQLNCEEVRYRHRRYCLRNLLGLDAFIQLVATNADQQAGLVRDPEDDAAACLVCEGRDSFQRLSEGGQS